MAKRASFVHGTVDGYKHCKPACKNCLAAYEASLNAETVPVPFPKESLPPTMDNPLDIIHFLNKSRFNTLHMFQIRDEWACEIRVNGDKFVGFGSTGEYAFADALRRMHSSDPETGPLTMTYNQSTFETSTGNGSGLAEEPTKLDKLWEDHGDSPSPVSPNTENSVTTADPLVSFRALVRTKTKSYLRQQAARLISGYVLVKRSVYAALSTESLGGLSDGQELYGYSWSQGGNPYLHTYRR